MILLHGGPAGLDSCIGVPVDPPADFDPGSLRISVTVTMPTPAAISLWFWFDRIMRKAGGRFEGMAFGAIAHDAVYEYDTTTEDGVIHFFYDRLESE